ETCAIFFWLVTATSGTASWLVAGPTRSWIFSFTEVCTMWCVALPLAACGAFIFSFPVWLVLFCMKIDEPLKAVVCIFRLRGKRWIRSVTRDFDDAKE
ncbi:MAG: hypothetical protein II328_04760, partial [Clostridia bacterium]|nr:hypothetical protein [Clostridia bacterium]